jgi:hypothetical protein
MFRKNLVAGSQNNMGTALIVIGIVLFILGILPSWEVLYMIFFKVDDPFDLQGEPRPAERLGCYISIVGACLISWGLVFTGIEWLWHVS